jgi:hypothetical protein
MPVVTAVHVHVVGLIAAISVKPEGSAVPGTPALEKLVNGIAYLGLIACGLAVLIGAAQIGFGQKSSNYTSAADGKQKVIYGFAGAFVIGAAAAIVNFFYNAGTAVH